MTAPDGERHADMSATLPPTALRTLSVPVEFFAGLRAASTPDAVRDAGFVAGQALFEHFGSWLADQGEASPTQLSDERFPWLLQAFFHGLGWGQVDLVPLSEAVMALDTSEWGEASDVAGSASGCLVSTGIFAGFFGRLADAPIAVLEVEPEVPAPGRCRFLLGSIDVMDYVWEAMERGIPYERAAASA